MYWKCSLHCTALHKDCLAELTGFTLLWSDKGKQSSKKTGCGLFFNSKWCSPRHVTVKEIICTPDIELLAVGFMSYYLPQELSHTVVIIVYIPSAASSHAYDVIHSTAAYLSMQHPSTFMTVCGDLNHMFLSKVK